MQHQAPGTLKATLRAGTSRAPSGGCCQSPCGCQNLLLPCAERQEGIGTQLPRTDGVRAHSEKCHHGDSSNTWTHKSHPAGFLGTKL